jgi:hypothetical protein
MRRELSLEGQSIPKDGEKGRAHQVRRHSKIQGSGIHLLKNNKVGKENGRVK